jgi:cytochrome c biogenesis protein CcmG/thiol:disulfide interchange protein DsbE
MTGQAGSRSPGRWLLAGVAGLFVLLLWLRDDRSGLIGEPAPAFTLPVAHQPGAAPEGARIRLEDLRGQVVVLDFWASWCGPCRASIPHMNEIAERYRERGVSVVGVNSEPMPPERLALVARAWRFAYPVVSDATMEAELAYRVDAYPTLVLVDRGGVVREVYYGAPGKAELAARIKSLLQ